MRASIESASTLRGVGIMTRTHHCKDSRQCSLAEIACFGATQVAWLQ